MNTQKIPDSFFKKYYMHKESVEKIVEVTRSMDGKVLVLHTKYDSFAVNRKDEEAYEIKFYENTYTCKNTFAELCKTYLESIGDFGNTHLIPDSFFEDFYYVPPHLISGAFKLARVSRDEKGEIIVLHTHEPYAFRVNNDSNEKLFAYGDNNRASFNEICKMYFTKFDTIEKRVKDLCKRRNKELKAVNEKYDRELKAMFKGK